nr:protein FAR1-RELATED SEQUENCE 5-like [Coffea arabica]
METLCRERGIGSVSYSPLRRGFLWIEGSSGEYQMRKRIGNIGAANRNGGRASIQQTVAWSLRVLKFESTEEAESFYIIPECVSFMRPHRKVGKSDLQQAVVMQQAGIRTSHIMRLLAVQARGYHNLGFHETDMYNALNRERQVAVGDGDSDSAIAFLLGKQRGDPNLFFKYSVDAHGHLNRLLWADSVCRDDYRYFGDVLVFDSTYSTNQYRFPLVVLCGVNNHYSTRIFACTFIVHEGDKGYNWVISTFLEAMHGRKPIAVVIDGDKSMRKCIKNLMLTAKHRLCSFHLEMNAATNVRDKEFL